MVVKAATHLHFLSPLLVAALGRQEEIMVHQAALVVALGKMILHQAALVLLGRVLQEAQAGLPPTALQAVAVEQEKSETAAAHTYPAEATLRMVAMEAMV
tara:strand:- start:99 stop:398 length:300 start_codon:yes stop_codon:yes gene_type:complete